MQKNTIKIIVTSIFCFVSMALLIILINPINNYYFYLIKSFAYQQICLLLIMIIISIILRSKIAIIVTSIVFVVFLLIVSNNLKIFIDSELPDNSQISVLHINLFIENDSIQEVMQLIENEDPDILSLQELSIENYKLIEEDLDDLFTYKYVQPSDSTMGIGFFSKVSLSKTETIFVDDNPIFDIKIELKEGEVDLIFLHAPAPLNFEMWSSQNNLFKELSSLIESKEERVIVIGDLNAVPWHNELSAIIKNNNLKAVFYLPFGTYPVKNTILKVPIDHIIISNRLNILKSKKVRIEGSDHFGIMAQVQMK